MIIGHSRPLPVALIAALGKAAEVAQRDKIKRVDICKSKRGMALEALKPLNPKLTGDQTRVMPMSSIFRSESGTNR